MKNRIASLIALAALSVDAQEVYGVMKKSKGKAFTNEKLSESLAEIESKDLTTAVSSLVDAGLIESAEDKESKTVSYVFPKTVAAKLEGSAANTIGGKTHTSKTANNDLVVYKGETVAFQPHTLSPEAKAGMTVQYGILNRTHLNEDGFQYFDVKKMPAIGTDPTGKCSKKSSTLLLVDAAGNTYSDPAKAPVPTETTAMIGLKKASGMEKPSNVDAATLDLASMKGSAVIAFTTEGSPSSRALANVLDEAQKANESSILGVNLDAYWNARLSAQLGIRQVPTLVNIKDGKVVSTVVSPKTSDDVNDFYAAAVKSQGKASPLSELPYLVESAKEEAEEAKSEKTEEDSAE